ncbi:MAG TPA: tRNA (adenosine(37)-N6)-dimethylallyltransferase MiaA [Candidatus Eisenbacteria bacterium]|jgi:tRNA dimethylallyltransferase
MTPVRVLAVVGATATGKTALGEAIARTLGAEIVCADSRQLFRELEVGTGKPTPEQRAGQPHHLFDALRLGQRASAGWYARACRDVRESVIARGRLPILVGGSGLYVRAARHGLAAQPPHDPSLRRRLQHELEAVGPEALHARLALVDPTIAARLAPRDRQRITRALEVYEASGRPLSWWHDQKGHPHVGEAWLLVELVVPLAVLGERIARRTRWMFENGLVEETRGLLEAGYGRTLRELRAVGYDEAMGLIEGQLTRAAAEERTSLRTRQLAKRQRTWFRHQVDAVHLDAATTGPGDLARAVLDVLARRSSP